MNSEVNINLDGKDDLEDVDENAYSRKSRKSNDSGKQKRGRGHKDNSSQDADRYSGKGAEFEVLDDGAKSGPVRSIEGYIVFVTSIHEEATEDDIHDRFSEFGVVKNLHLPLDRRTGFVKGYALVEYDTKEEAETAIKEMNGSEFMDNTLGVDFAFTKEGGRKKKSSR
eukprot:TRINITY_DN10152_c0_g1_i1.p1 TRINITY_DN10152_c0_g1~~TRINITY_DN10152_c0_g1_i1.p1  ORF type:complete len:187 (-),score=67.46 TRINITY_DN10152_c0_g1_i1:119-622(-)